MHFYDYWSPNDTIENPCYAAAQSLIENNIEVLPLKAGTKEPSDEIRDVAKFRQHPIHSKNLMFYFDRPNIEIAIMLRQNMEVIDVDSKHKAGLSEEFLNAIKKGWPELYDKLVISKTPTGGLHILYRSEIIGGKKQMAQINGTPNPITIIERINESTNNYIKCAPSNGYSFIQGNPMEIQTISSDERNWICAVCASFNKIIIPEVKIIDAEREDSPWNVFNSQNDHTYIISELRDRNWQVLRELNDRYVIKMPGGKQHSGIVWKDTSCLYLYTVNSEFIPEKQYSPFGVYAHFYHDGNVALACRALADKGIGKNIYDEGAFWKREKSKIVIKYTELMAWLHYVGYRIHDGTIVKITDNILSIIQERDLRAAFLNEIEPEMVDLFYDKVSTVFSETGGVMSMLQPLDIDKVLRDDKHSTWLFFENYAVKITPDQILPMQYKEVDGYIWKDTIIPRRWVSSTDYTGCDAERFTGILGGGKVADLHKILGYLLSRYKDPLNPRAVVFIEDIDAETEGESQGGSGKGLLFSFVRQFRKVAEFDGKTFDPKGDRFAYQNVDLDTNLIFIDDVRNKFNFNILFSILTSALPVQKKNAHLFTIPFSDSPKVCITSNYNVGEMDASTARRKYEFAVIKHFGQHLSPIDEFGRQFFDEWDALEWSKFDNFMAYCAQQFLAVKDRRNIGSITANSAERALRSNTNTSFVEYMDTQKDLLFYSFAGHALLTYNGYLPSGAYTTNGVNIADLNRSPDHYLVIAKSSLLESIKTKIGMKNLTTTTLTRWLMRWAEARNVSLDCSYKRSNDSERCYRIVGIGAVSGDGQSGKSEFDIEENCNGQNLQSGNFDEIPF